MAGFGKFRSKANGQVYTLPMSYAKPGHPFASRFELLPDDFEEDKVVVQDTIPSQKAVKAEWEAYAARHGIQTTGMTKDQIISAVEGSE